MKNDIMKTLKEELNRIKQSVANNGYFKGFTGNDGEQTASMFVVLNSGDWFILGSNESTLFPSIDTDDIVFLMLVRGSHNDLRYEFCNSDIGDYNCVDDCYGGFFDYLKTYNGKNEIKTY